MSQERILRQAGLFMVTVSRRARGRGSWAALLFAGLVGALTTATVSSQEVKGRGKDGLYLLVPPALQQKHVNRLKQRIDDALKKEHRKIEIIIFDFNPGGRPNGSSD